LGWFIELLIVVALDVVAYLISPKPKAPKNAAMQDAQEPTAEAGRELPVPFGTVTIQSPNTLWFGEKAARQYQVNA
jgi:hypothetical protein